MELPEDCWLTQREEVRAEHLLEQAAKDLRDGWKAWIAQNGSGTALEPLQAPSQPLESPRGRALIELVLCACACGSAFDYELHLRT